MDQPVCPNPKCRSDPGVTTYSLAPNQAVCPNGACPVNSWQTDKRLDSDTVGSYLPAETVDEGKD